MRKTIAWFVALAMLLCAAGAFAESSPSVFASLAGVEWTFSSGVGGWSTDMRILADGSFSGEYHDSEMGDAAEAYPDGTVYCCSFTGRMSAVAEENGVWTLHVDELKTDESQAEVDIDEGIRYIRTEPYGIREGSTLLLYQPGTPVSDLPEEMVFWAHVMDVENPPAELETWFLRNDAEEAGFVGFAPEATAFIPNPWLDLSEEELAAAAGVTFGVPEGAENVIWRYLPAESLAEMQFTLDGREYCARIQPADLRDGELANISGMYFAWEQEEAVTVGGCAGTVSHVSTGSEDRVALCLWYDAAPGLMYSLSVYTTDLDGLDLAAVAAQVYVPAQGNV